MPRKIYKLEDYVQHIQDLLKKRDIKQLCYVLFGDTITQGQAEIISSIVYRDHLRILINCYTRYGKSFCVSRAIGILILTKGGSNYSEFEIQSIAPTNSQARIIMDNVHDCIQNCDLIKDLLPFDLTDDADKLKKEATKSRIRFTNGVDLRIFSAEGRGDRLMGFGSKGVVISDEECLIALRVWTAKISRMLGDSPDTAYISLGNPWHRDNQFFAHYVDENYYKIHIDWRQGVKEGRVTQAFIDEQRRELSELEFTILYESLFPETSEDALYSISHVKIAMNHPFELQTRLRKIIKILSNPSKYSPEVLNKVKKEADKYTFIIANDPADKGMDKTVIYWGIKYDARFELIDWYAEPKSENMQIVGRIFDIYKNFCSDLIMTKIQIDRVGVGVGEFSRLQEVVSDKGMNNIEVIGCHFGETAMKSDNFINKKSENNFRLASLFIDQLISIDGERFKDAPLLKQLSAMRWDFTSSGKKKVIDPDSYSPDFVDTLVYFVWKDSSNISFDFLTDENNITGLY